MIHEEIVTYEVAKLAKEKERLVYAANKITELGYSCKWDEQSKCILLVFRSNVVRFYPYTGWFSGVTVTDGRGLNNLLKQIKSK